MINLIVIQMDRFEIGIFMVFAWVAVEVHGRAFGALLAAMVLHARAAGLLPRWIGARDFYVRVSNFTDLSDSEVTSPSDGSLDSDSDDDFHSLSPVPELYAEGPQEGSIDVEADRHSVASSGLYDDYNAGSSTMAQVGGRFWPPFPLVCRGVPIADRLLTLRFVVISSSRLDHTLLTRVTRFGTDLLPDLRLESVCWCNGNHMASRGDVYELSGPSRRVNYHVRNYGWRLSSPGPVEVSPLYGEMESRCLRILLWDADVNRFGRDRLSRMFGGDVIVADVNFCRTEDRMVTLTGDWSCVIDFICGNLAYRNPTQPLNYCLSRPDIDQEDDSEDDQKDGP